MHVCYECLCKYMYIGCLLLFLKCASMNCTRYFHVMCVPACMFPNTLPIQTHTRTQYRQLTTCIIYHIPPTHAHAHKHAIQQQFGSVLQQRGEVGRGGGGAHAVVAQEAHVAAAHTHNAMQHTIEAQSMVIQQLTHQNLHLAQQKDKLMFMSHQV